MDPFRIAAFFSVCSLITSCCLHHRHRRHHYCLEHEMPRSLAFQNSERFHLCCFLSIIPPSSNQSQRGIHQPHSVSSFSTPFVDTVQALASLSQTGTMAAQGPDLEKTLERKKRQGRNMDPAIKARKLRLHHYRKQKTEDRAARHSGSA